MTRRPRNIPLQAILVVPFVVQLCLAVGVTGWLSWRNGQRAVNELALKAQDELGDRVKLKLSHYLEVPIRVSRLNAEAVASGQLPVDNLDNAEPELFRRLLQFESVSGILLANPNGDARAVNRRDGFNLLHRDPKTNPTAITEYRLTPEGKRQAIRQTFSAPDVREAPWYKSAVEAKGLVWSPIFQTGDRPDLSLNASQPVYRDTNQDGKPELLGVVSSGIVLSVINQFLYSLDVSPNGSVFVVDRNGLLIGSSRPSQPIYQPWQAEANEASPSGSFPKLQRIQAENALDPLVRETTQHLLSTFGDYAALETQQFSFKGNEGRNFVKVVPYVDGLGIDWRVMVVVPEKDFMAQIHRNTRSTLLLSGVALLGAIALGIVTARLLARSILRLSQASQAIAQGNLDHTLSENSPIQEVATVAHSFNQMAAQLRTSFTHLETQVEERTLQLQQSFDFEETLKRLTDKVRDSLAEDQILQTAVEELAIAVGVRGCNAAIYDLVSRTSTVQYEYTNFSKRFQGRRLKMANFAGYGQLLQGEHFQHCGLQLAPSRGRVAMLSCPLRDDQGVLGDLWLIKSASEAFSDQEIRLVQQVANQCAIAIRQARLYQAAQTQVSELERLNQLKDDFLSTISHELRTPIANMKMAIQMLEIGLKQKGILDPSQAESGSPIQRYFDILKDECQRESTLITNLLDLSRLDAASEQPDLQPLPDVVDWLQQLVAPYKAQDIHPFQLQIPPTLPPIRTDISHLERILTELLNNADKYTPHGESIAVVAYPQTEALVFEVRNTGVEIPEAEQARIFERFYRIPTNDPWKHGGTGLGLALVKMLTERLGGQVELHSDRNSTTFTVTLPQNYAVPSPSPNLSASAG